MELKTKIFIIIVIVFLASVSFLITWNTYYYNEECLKELAIKYCEEKNMTFDRGMATRVVLFDRNGFICEREIINPRKSKAKYLEHFLFLEEELIKCLN